MIVADSSALIEYLRGREPFLGRIRGLVRNRQLATNVIVRYEVLFSETRGSPSAVAAHKVLDNVPCRTLGIAAANRALEVGRALRDKKASARTPDVLIAAIALHHGDEILTANRKHFEPIDGLRLAPV